MKKLATFAFLVAATGSLAGGGQARDLTFDERVEAQAAIERVYYSHRTGIARSFEESVPGAVIEDKVRSYLQQSVALEQFWHTPVTTQMLEREVQRMTRDTKMPERLRELFSALGDDPFLVQECLARQVLVDRLTRNFFAWDERIHGATRRDAEELEARLVKGAIDPRAGHRWRSVVELLLRADPDTSERAYGSRTSELGAGRIHLETHEFTRQRERLPDRVGDIGPLAEWRESYAVDVVLDETPGRITVASYVTPKTGWDTWWQRVRQDFDGMRVRPAGVPRNGIDVRTLLSQTMDFLPCPPDDTWDNGSLDDVPMPRRFHTAVWTGSEMIVWGGIVHINFALDTGGRYDPATDTWRPTSTVNAPTPRGDHTAVWTGSEMVVWGGAEVTSLVNGGGRYDPVSDSWTATSTVGPPSPRYRHAAVWTGSEMIVWGGDVGGGNVSDGGRYAPATDTWAPTSTVDAPSPRQSHSVVWAGSEMVVWGGIAGSRVKTGSRYNPTTDLWRPTSTVNAPSSRNGHTAVWTGNEMVVWGGYDGINSLDNGGRYDPATDVWSPMTTQEAPPLAFHVAVWTGSEMIVWGTSPTGGRYDPVADAWAPVSTVNAPSFRNGATAIWTGMLMIVWGGQTEIDPPTNTDSGGRYDPATDNWTPVSGIASGRESHTAVWTGSEMIVWGGGESYYGLVHSVNTGSRYDPATDNWTPTTTVNTPGRRADHTAVWTGAEMIVWGGYEGIGALTSLNGGGRYDPASDTWTTTSTAGAPSPRTDHIAVWTGTDMVVWGGIGPEGFNLEYFNNGGRYDPETDTWVPTSTERAPSPRYLHAAVWTGRHMIVWGGRDDSMLDTGGRYDAAADLWVSMGNEGAPSPRIWFTAVWTGREMVVWGGWDSSNLSNLDTGARYDSTTDTWTPMSIDEAPWPNNSHTAVWTGREMIVWGQGLTGGRYDPETDSWRPVSLEGASTWGGAVRQTAVWTGRMMIVWGGAGNASFPTNGGRYFVDGSTDYDGDGLSGCEGDCNDGAASAFPGAPEICDGLDQDCNGAADDGDADGDGFFVCEDCDDGNPDAFMPPADVTSAVFGADSGILFWDPVLPVHGGVVVYDVVRGALAELPGWGGPSETCVASGVIGNESAVQEIPGPGEGYWYLVRAREGCTGSYGTTSAGGARYATACSGG